MRNSASLIRGAAPETPRFIAVAPESFCYFGAAFTAPTVPASESALGSHLCVALSSAQVLSEWEISTRPVNHFALNGIALLTSCLTPGVHFTFRNRTRLYTAATHGIRMFSPAAGTSLFKERTPTCRSAKSTGIL
jgi:hypothetical protein